MGTEKLEKNPNDTKEYNGKTIGGAKEKYEIMSDRAKRRCENTVDSTQENTKLEKRVKRLILEQDLALASMAAKVRKSKMETDKIVAILEEKVKEDVRMNVELRDELRKTIEIRDLIEVSLKEEKRKNEELKTKFASIQDAEKPLKAVVEENKGFKVEAARGQSKHAMALIERLKNDLASKENQRKEKYKEIYDNAKKKYEKMRHSATEKYEKINGGARKAYENTRDRGLEK